jgi:hypothetical protein
MTANNQFSAEPFFLDRQGLSASHSMTDCKQLSLSPITLWHGPCSENTALILLCARVLGFPHDRYPGSPLTRWLLPRNSCSTDPKGTLLLLLCVRLIVFTESLPSNRSIHHTVLTTCTICFNIEHLHFAHRLHLWVLHGSKSKP